MIESEDRESGQFDSALDDVGDAAGASQLFECGRGLVAVPPDEPPKRNVGELRGFVVSVVTDGLGMCVNVGDGVSVGSVGPPGEVCKTGR